MRIRWTPVVLAVLAAACSAPTPSAHRSPAPAKESTPASKVSAPRPRDCFTPRLHPAYLPPHVHSRDLSFETGSADWWQAWARGSAWIEVQGGLYGQHGDNGDPHTTIRGKDAEYAEEDPGIFEVDWWEETPCGRRAYVVREHGFSIETMLRVARSVRSAGYARTCSARDIAITDGEAVSEATGQHTYGYVLRNKGSGCHLKGYPRIELVNSGGEVLPFEYRDAGDQMVTDSLPTIVQLPPGGEAFFRFNHYRCDLGDRDAGAVMRVRLPGNAQTISVAARVSFCGAGDPGTGISISPIEPNPFATGSH